jgi:hypothetical protein
MRGVKFVGGEEGFGGWEVRGREIFELWKVCLTSITQTNVNYGMGEE